MQIKKTTIVRTIMTLIVVINLILKAFGINVIDVSENTVAAFVEAAVEIGAIVSAFWYNNSFTKEARQADEFFKQLKGDNNV